MDKGLHKDLSSLNDNLGDQNDEADDSRTLFVSSDRQQIVNDNGNSIILNESRNEHRHLNSVDGTSENNEGQVDRENSTVDMQQSKNIPRHSELTAPTTSENNESSFMCKYPGCNFTTLDAESYFKHEDGHEEIGTVCCDVCNMAFRTYAIMRRHQLQVHQGIRTFECQHCSKRFLRKDQFVEHLVSNHSETPYRCSFCGEHFSFRNHLKTHISTEHTGIASGKTCHLCNFKASSPNAIKVHYATFHLMQNSEALSGNPDRAHNLHVASLARNNHVDNSAIDLATVSQNFSYVAARYPVYSMPIGDNNGMVPGPSDLSCRPKVIQNGASPNTHNVAAHTNEQNAIVPVQDDDNRHQCVTSIPGSTVISPPTCQERACQHLEQPVRNRMCIKPEPAELIVDDSQSSNVQPTSTMDLSTNEIVETSGTSEAMLAETLCRRKVHKHSSSDDTGSESHQSPSNRLSVDAPSNSRAAHTCFRFRPYEESSQRCREYARHTCSSHRHNSDKRTRLLDCDVDRTSQNDQSDNEERKIFYNRATSTNNSFVPLEVHYPRSNHTSNFHGEGPSCTSASHNVSNYFGRKNFVIHNIESRTLTCTFCGIIFPDQTLYLLHRSLHSEGSPWKCNLCGKTCKDKYDFNSHVISKGHY